MNISVIIPSYHTKRLTLLCVHSFVKNFKDCEIIVVENSNEKYNGELENIPNIKFINNDTKTVDSYANAEAILVGLEHCVNEDIFLAHSDSFVFEGFYDALCHKYNEGYRLIGTFVDVHPKRIKAYHVSGLLTQKKILKSVDLYPVSKNEKINSLRDNYTIETYRNLVDNLQDEYCSGVFMDVGDSITDYCRKNNIKMFCFENTINNPEIKIGREYNEIAQHCCVWNNKVIYLHKRRGTVGLINSLVFKKGTQSWNNNCTWEIKNDKWCDTLEKKLNEK